MECVKIDLIKPNPFRNLSVNPFNNTHIKALAESIRELDFIGALPARKIDDSTYELACGHSRLEALKSLGIQDVDLNIHTYSDREMAELLVDENTLQKEHQFLSILDSVQAVIKMLSNVVVHT